MILFHAKRDGTVTTTPNFVPQGSSMQDLVVVSEFDYAYCAIKLFPASGEYIEDTPCTPILQRDFSTIFTASLNPKATVVAGSVDYQLIFTAADGTTQTTLVGSFTVPRGVPVSTPGSVEELSVKTVGDLYAIMANTYGLFVGHEGDITKNKTEIAQNKTDIAKNTTNIAQNKTDITKNKTDITKNKTDITKNTTNIAQNKTDIAKNTTNIAQNKTDIAALKKTISSAGYVTIPVTEWEDGTPTTASFMLDGFGSGMTALLIPADILTQTAAREARLSAFPLVFGIDSDTQTVQIVRANADKAPNVLLRFAYMILKTASAAVSPSVAILGVDAYGEGGGTVDETAVKAIITEMLGNVDNVQQYSADNPPPYPVTSVNGKTGAVSLTIPSKASDVGADPAGTASSKLTTHNVDTASHQDLRQELQRLADRLNAALNSDDTSLDDFKEIVAYIKSNKTLIDGITSSKVNVTDIVDNLVTNVSNKPLSAAQGVALKLLIDTLEDVVEGKTTPDQVAAQIKTALTPYITREDADKAYQPKEDGKGLSTNDYTDSDKAAVTKAASDSATAVNTANRAEQTADEVKQMAKSGELDGAPGAPGYTPVAGVDYPTDAQIDTKIAAALAQRNQLEPLRAESEDWLSENGDPTKVYIVPNADGQGGKVYAYAEVEGEVTKTLKDAVCGPETYQIDHWVADAGYSTSSRIGSDGTVKQGTDQASGYIPASVGSTIKVENLALTPKQTCYVAAYDESGAVTGSQMIQNTYNGSEISTAGNTNTWCDTKTASSFTATLSVANFGTGFTKIRINGVLTNATVTVATVEKIVRWYAFTDFVATDDARINAIDDRLKVLEAGGTNRVKTREAALRLIKKWDKPVYDQLEPFMLDHTLSVDSSRWATYYDADDKDGSKRRAQVTALYGEYDALCTSYPDFVRDITNVAHGLEGATETTYGGLCSDGIQSVKVYEFREVDPLRNEPNNEWSETKPKVILISGIHWEWGGVYALFNALKEITTNPALRYIRRNMHFIVMPITNPYCFTTYKNSGEGHYNKNGVEIHNNFEVDFGNASDSTHGTKPLSEIETRYINNVMRKHSDAAYMVSCHSHQGNSKTPNRTIWPSTATYFGCNLGYRLIDMMSFALAQKYGTDWSGDNRAGHASLSSSSGTEGKQAMLYGIHGMSLEIGDTFYAFSSDTLSDYVVTHGAETYINFIRLAMTAYSIHDREKYAPKPAYEIE